nr:hypothetical protein [Natronogracilivirga saccharolytica]
MKLGAIICSNRFKSLLILFYQFYSSFFSLKFASVGKFANQHISGFAFNQRQDTMLIPGSDNRIDFPMADSLPFLNRCRPFGNMSLPGKSSPAVITLITLAALFAGSAQMRVQNPTSGFICPYVPINRLMRDIQKLVALQPSGDLLRTPLSAQKKMDLEIIPVTKLLITPGARSAAVGLLLSLKRAIMAKATAVTAKFSTDRAAMTVRLPGNFRLAETLFS